MTFWPRSDNHCCDLLSIVQLWSRNNYHWYLKQEYQFSSMDVHVSEMLWDAEHPLKLNIICNGIFYLTCFNCFVIKIFFTLLTSVYCNIQYVNAYLSSIK